MRAVDKDFLLKHQRKVKFFGLGPDDESWGYAVPTEIIENAPTLTSPNEPERAGLYGKYTVYKNKDGSLVSDCFILRPAKDPAAAAALRAYAATTDNAELAADIINWVGTEPNEPLTCKGCIHEHKEHEYCNYCERAPYLGDYYYRRPPEEGEDT